MSATKPIRRRSAWLRPTAALVALLYAGGVVAQQRADGPVVAAGARSAVLPFGPDEQRLERGCDNMREPKVEPYEEKFGRANYFFDAPDTTLRNIDGVKVDGRYLMLSVTSKATYAERSGETYRIGQKTSYEAKPVSTLIATTILVGLPLLFAPKQVFNGTVGCSYLTDTRKLLKLAADDPKTGKTYSTDYPQTFELVVSGLGADATFTVRGDGSVPLRVDLSSLIARAELAEESALTVRCTNCARPDDPAALPATLKTSYDFRPLQQQMVAAEQARLAEEERLREQALRLKRAQEEQEMQARREEAERIRRAELAAQEAKRKREQEERERERQQQKSRQLQSL